MTLPKVLRRINVLKFTAAENTPLPHVFKMFANAVGLLESDHLNVYKRNETEFYIWRYKNDQRTVQFPSELKFVERHTLCSGSGGNNKQFHLKLLSALTSLECMPRLVCLTVGPLEQTQPTNVLAVCRDMSRFELLVTRLLAQMTPDEERDSFQRASRS